MLTETGGSTTDSVIQTAHNHAATSDSRCLPGRRRGGGTVVTLSNGVAVTGISASTGAWKHYKIAVPASQTKLDIVMSGGTGDGDLYVKRRTRSPEVGRK